MGHLVRIIAIDDFPHGKAYKGDVLQVKAGYFRNYLFPKKKAVYATRLNFEKIGIPDPQQNLALTTTTTRTAATEADDKDLKAADVLKYYLRNKLVRAASSIDVSS
jgi:ribosomal protein L9